MNHPTPFSDSFEISFNQTAMMKYMLALFVCLSANSVVFGAAEDGHSTLSLSKSSRVISIAGHPPSNGEDTDFVAIPIPTEAVSAKIKKYISAQKLIYLGPSAERLSSGGEYLRWHITFVDNGVPSAFLIEANFLITSDGRLFRAPEDMNLYMGLAGYLANVGLLPHIHSVELVPPAPAPAPKK